MGSHFYDWIDFNGVVIFNRVTIMGSHIFGILGSENSGWYGFKWEDFNCIYFKKF